MPVIKLELSASVGFIHKESITMHGHTILKFFQINTHFACNLQGSPSNEYRIRPASVQYEKMTKSAAKILKGTNDISLSHNLP